MGGVIPVDNKPVFDIDELREKWKELKGTDIGKMTEAVMKGLLSDQDLVIQVGNKLLQAEKYVEDVYVSLQTRPDLEDLPEEYRENASENLKSLMNSLQTMNNNWEKLAAYLQLKVDEKTEENAIHRLQVEKSALDTESENKAAKIEENLRAMEEAATNKSLMLGFGWVLAIVAVASAAVTGGASIAAFSAGAATVGGTVAATGVAGGAVAASTTATTTAAATLTSTTGIVKTAMLAVSATLAVTNQALETTGDMDKLKKDLADSLRTQGCKDPDLAADLIIGIGTAVAIMGTSIPGQGALTAAFSYFGQTMLKVGFMTAETAVGAMTITQQGFSVKANYDAGMAQADVQEVESQLQALNQLLEETQEEVNEIMDQIMDLLSNQIAKLIDSALESREEIVENIPLGA